MTTASITGRIAAGSRARLSVGAARLAGRSSRPTGWSGRPLATIPPRCLTPTADIGMIHVSDGISDNPCPGSAGSSEACHE